MDDLQPETTTGSEIVLDGFAGGEFQPIDVGVLTDDGGVFPSVGRDDENLGLLLDLCVRMPFGVGGFQAESVRLDPDLKQVQRFGAGGIEFAVRHSRTGAHQLDLSGE